MVQKSSKSALLFLLIIGSHIGSCLAANLDFSCNIEISGSQYKQFFDEISQVQYISDGDTLKLNDGRKLRLIGINAPELAHDKKLAELFATEARNALKSLFNKDKTIALIYGNERKDHYGRVLAHAFLIDGQNIQASLLNQGMARAIAIPPNDDFSDCYIKQEHFARCANNGVWKNSKILSAEKLTRSDIGFQIIEGKVTDIEINNRGIWLTIDKKLSIGIRPENLALFDNKQIKSLLNHSVQVRGWLLKRKKPSPYYLRIRHPSSIQLSADINCL